MKMSRKDIPSEGIEIIGIGRILPGQEIEIPEEMVDVMRKKGFKITANKKKEGDKK